MDIEVERVFEAVLSRLGRAPKSIQLESGIVA
jgi:hypothetical protein